MVSATDPLVPALLSASRALVAVSASSLACVEDIVTPTQFRTLVVLSQGPQTIVGLAARMAVNPSTSQRQVERLSRLDLVSRGVNPEDRRELLVSLTPQGRRIVRKVTDRRTRELARIVDRMDHTDSDALVRALESFAAAAGEPAADRDASRLGW